MALIREKLFEEAERRDLADSIAKMETAAQQAIEKQPERREAIIQRLNELAEKFVRGEVQKKRKEAMLFGAAVTVVGILILWLGTWLEIKLVVLFGGSALISGLGTVLVNWIILLSESLD